MIKITKEEVNPLIDDHNLIRIDYTKDNKWYTRFFIKPYDEILQWVMDNDTNKFSLADILNDDSIKKEIYYTPKPEGYPEKC